MHILSNARVKTTYMVGDMSEVGVEGWYHSEGIANNLSVALIKNNYQVTYYSRFDNTFRVWNKKKPSSDHSGNLI